MRYKVIDYISNDSTEVETGTCELCFGVGIQNNDVLIVEDETGKRIEVSMHDWDWGDLTNYYIDNIVSFSEWLSKKEIDYEVNVYSVLNLIDEFNDRLY